MAGTARLDDGRESQITCGIDLHLFRSRPGSQDPGHFFVHSISSISPLSEKPFETSDLLYYT